MSGEPPLKYLALGDSYSAGTGASSRRAAFPRLLGRHLAAATGRLVELTNPAADGFTTEDVIRSELPVLERTRPDRVTILIGANDVIQGRSLAQYRASLIWIYDRVAALGLPPRRIAGISVPDWSVTPAAAQYGDPGALRLEIEAFNLAAWEEATSRGFAWADITEVSRSGAGASGWLADDGLHPADAQYQEWAEVIWRAVAAGWTPA